MCGRKREPFRRPMCPASQVGAASPAPYKPFCSTDEVCIARMQSFHIRYWENLQAYEKAERDQESYGFRKVCMSNLKLAWDEWHSAFHNHRGCQDKRHNDREFHELFRWGLIERRTVVDDAQRLQYNPMRVPEPDVGKVKH